MSTFYEKAVELLVSDIQDKALKDKVEAINEKAEMKINETSKNIIFYPSKHFNDGLINASIPLTRRERRKLERKKKKNGII